MSIVTEIVDLKTAEEVSEKQFIQIVNELENEFHSKQPGFIDTELLRNEKSRSWMIIQHWGSMEDVKAVNKKMFKESITEDFRNALDHKSVKITVFFQIKTWSSK